MNENETRGQLIVRLREDHLWTREELAKRAGVTPTTVTQAETGRTHVRLKTIGKLADALGVPASRLLRPAEEKELATPGKDEAPGRGFDLEEILRTNHIPGDLSLEDLGALRKALAGEIKKPSDERQGQPPISLYFAVGLEISMHGGRKIDELEDLRRVQELVAAHG